MARIGALLIVVLLAAGQAGAVCTVTNTFSAATTAVAAQVNANFTDLKTCVETLQGRDSTAELESVEGVNILLATEIDSKAELNAIIAGDDALFGTDLGVTVQGYDTDLVDLADGSLSGTKVGTGISASNITSGTLPSAQLPTSAIESTDIDTSAELNAIVLDTDFITATGTYDMAVTGSAIFSGTLQGGVYVTTSASTSETVAATGLLGGLRYYTSASGMDVTLPGAAAGLNSCFYDGNGGGVITIDAAAGDEIILDGQSVGTADAIDSAGTKGDFICLLAIDATSWISLGRSGTWVDGGAD